MTNFDTLLRNELLRLRAAQTELEAENARLRTALAEIAEEDGMPVGRAFPDNRKRLRALSNI